MGTPVVQYSFLNREPEIREPDYDHIYDTEKYAALKNVNLSNARELRSV